MIDSAPTIGSHLTMAYPPGDGSPSSDRGWYPIGVSLPIGPDPWSDVPWNEAVSIVASGAGPSSGDTSTIAVNTIKVKASDKSGRWFSPVNTYRFWA